MEDSKGFNLNHQSSDSTSKLKSLEDSKHQTSESYKSKLIGSGGYGCSFQPPLPCKKSKLKKQNRSRSVGKIIRKEEAKIELTISQIIQGIPNYTDYFIIQEKDNCSSQDFAKFRKSQKSFSRCPPPVLRSSNTSLAQLLSPYGGVPLYDYQIPSHFSFIETLKHMLEGIHKLNSQGICHFDIKEGNIVVDSKGIFRLIDFGIALQGDLITREELKFYSFSFSPEHASLAPEVSVQNGILSRIPLYHLISQTIHHKRILQLKGSLLGISLKTQEEELEAFWNSDPISLNAISTNNWVEWYHTYWRTWDIWAVGVVFLRLLQRCLFFPWFQDQYIKKGFILKHVLKGLLEVDPRRRLSIEKALELLG